MQENELQKFSEALGRRRTLVAELMSDPSSYASAGPTDAAINLLSQIDDALERIKSHSFGVCTVCHEDVDLDHVQLDFTSSVCLDHYSGAQRSALEKDLELAAKVQKNLLPSAVPRVEGLEIAARLEPKSVVGGDYFDFFDSADRHLGVAIADVMGKGLAASMLMSNLQASLRILGPEYAAPHRLMQRLNELFRFNVRIIRFISMFVACFDVESKRIMYSNAGHHPPILKRSRQSRIEFLKPTGPALGLVPDAEFTTEELIVESDDLLLLYTDGLVEVRNPSGAEFGEDGLARFLESDRYGSAQNTLSGLLDTIHEFREGEWSDDVTVLAVRVA